MKHFCVAPWFHQSITIRPFRQPDEFCCWARDHAGKDVSRKTTQDKMLNDERPSECQKCWDAEDSGVKSRRQQENTLLDHLLDLDIKNIENRVHNGQDEILVHQVRLNNICNGTCVMCNSDASSAWGKLEKRAGLIPTKTFDHSPDFVDSIINYNTVRAIELLGGEPLLSDTAFHIFTQLIEHNNTDCFISIVTNGSISITDKYKEILSQFSRLSITVSIDAIGKPFEYLRFPLKWDLVSSNINEYKEICNDVNISCTVTNMSAGYLDSTIAWFNENNLNYFLHNVIKPEYMAPDVQPGHKLWPTFAEGIKKQDALKGISMKDYLPDMWEQVQNS